jgi:hypothetical protein
MNFQQGFLIVWGHKQGTKKLKQDQSFMPSFSSMRIIQVPKLYKSCFQAKKSRKLQHYYRFGTAKSKEGKAPDASNFVIKLQQQSASWQEPKINKNKTECSLDHNPGGMLKLQMPFVTWDFCSQQNQDRSARSNQWRIS